MESTITVNDDRQGLTERERSDLAGCEEIIGLGLRSFVEVGLALGKIRDERLYRQDYYDFGYYCRQRWGTSRIHAHRRIEAAKVYEMLPIGNRPANEAQVRPLTRIRAEGGDLDCRAIAGVWRRVVDNAPVDAAGRRVITAQSVDEAARPVLRRRGIRTGPGPRPRHRASKVIKDDGVDTAAKDPMVAGKIISDDEFARLHEHAEKLAELMITELLPTSVRLAIEGVCDIVLGDPT